MGNTLRKEAQVSANDSNMLVGQFYVPEQQLINDFDRSFGLEMVDIFVGPEKEHFHVHKKPLCARVPYFDKMFCGQFLESEQQSATLPEDDPIVFNLFLMWVYGDGSLAPVDFSKNTVDSGPILDRIKLYGFAEKICLTELSDYLMTTLISNLSLQNRTLSLASVTSAYELTRPESPSRKYISHSLTLTVKLSGPETSSSNNINIKRLLSENEDILKDTLEAIR
ncbi:hypothetical protein LSUE1_G005344 [Lachnellula suecica]|uniref:BTB domain-containing protein n=1 Tax=Lachnellula suecica TaxID=602035 RepID=A0A8T9C454_9HELO|nr:hypothetical protein LSUE1_G005344 [Lachnellula suecica]